MARDNLESQASDDQRSCEPAGARVVRGWLAGGRLEHDRLSRVANGDTGERPASWVSRCNDDRGCRRLMRCLLAGRLVEQAGAEV